VPLTIDKKNADAKPPSLPFMIQVAMRSNRDVYFFQVPCMLHNLVNPSKEIAQHEFKPFWDKLQNQVDRRIPLSSLNAAFDQSKLMSSLGEGLSLSNFKVVAQNGDVLQTGAWLVNNLPLLMEVSVQGSEINLVMKFPVPQLKGLFEESVFHILTRTNN
jgi:AP-2 complex subunit beta-1/AP-1 complex subunit beta-1